MEYKISADQHSIVLESAVEDVLGYPVAPNEYTLGDYHYPKYRAVDEDKRMQITVHPNGDVFGLDTANINGVEELKGNIYDELKTQA